MPLLFTRHQVNLYVLFLVGRVGSSYLTSMLNSHPQVRALGEKSLEFKDRDGDEQNKMAGRWLTPPLVSAIGSMGFNAKYVHLSDPSKFAQLLHDRKCRIFHMQRRNKIKAVVSHLNGTRLSESTGKWGLYNASNRPEPFVIDPVEFDTVLRKRETRDMELEDYVRSLDLPTLNLFYEDLLIDKDSFLYRVFHFLGITPRLVTSSTLKVTSDNLREVVINFQELRNLYRGTNYEPMFDEIIIS